MYGITPVFYKNYTAFMSKNESGKKKYKYIINTGGSRSSKTYSIIELIHQICQNNKNIRATAWRDTKKDCRDTIWKDYQKILSLSNRLDYRFRNKTEASYFFPDTNSAFEFHGTDDEEKVHGLTQQIAWINEPYKISKETFNQIDMRSDVVFIDWNPKKNHWIDDLSKQPNAIVIHSTFSDNPFCPEQSKIKILSYDPSNEQNVINGTADLYNWQVYGLGLRSEKPNRIYKGWQILDENINFDDLPYPSYYGLDFGKRNPTALVEVKFDGDKTFFLNEKFYKPLDDLNGLQLYEVLEQIIPDKSIPIVCDYADPNAISDLRINGFNALPCTPKNVSNRILFVQSKNIVVTKSSENIWDEYENYEWEIVNGFNLDRPLKKDDHIMDAIGYILEFLKLYLHIK